MRFSFLTVALCALVSPLPAAPGPDFSRDVRPVLSRYCFKCHGPDEESRKGGLRLDLQSAALAPAKSGKAAIVPGKGNESELVKRILSRDPDDLMPPPAAKSEITEAQRDILKRWVESGAEYQEHWAFTPPKKPVVPETSVEGFKAATTSPIDHFVAARLATGGLIPSPPADPVTLLRRVTLDLTGLPPSAAAVETFTRLASATPGKKEEVYAAYVDRIMASPQYGERWARKWLDLARYADTNGYEKDRARQIWPWRDWVVDALNADMPFDEFTVEQLAGDMLPHATAKQIIATGFHRNSMLNEEGGIDPLEFRFNAMTDRMAVTGATWLGLTIQCAQCHTHKFDPLQHREYYQLMAFLDNAGEPDYAIRPPDADAVEQQRAKRLAGLIAGLPDHWPADGMRWETPRPARVLAGDEAAKVLEDGSVLLPPKGPGRAQYVIEFDAPSGGLTDLKLEALTDPSLPSRGPGRTPHGNFVLTEISVSSAGAGVITSAQADAEQSGFPVTGAFDGNPSTGWAVDTGGKLNSPKTAVFHLAKPLRGRITVKLDQQYGGGHTMGRVRLSTGTAIAGNAPRESAERAFAAWLPKERAKAVAWTPLKPERAVSTSPLLTVLPDNSVLASGDITKADTFDLTFHTTLTEITAVRLEVLPHDSLPGRGPGMAFYEGPKGDFFMGEFQIATGGKNMKFAAATDTYTKNGFGSNAGSRQAFDGDPQTGWSTSGAEGKANEAVFVLDKPLTPVRGELSLKMLFGRHYACTLGHFRISVTTGLNALASPLGAEAQALLVKNEALLTAGERTTLRTAFFLNAPELGAVRKEIDALRQPPAWQTTLVMRERAPENPRPTFIHHRGEYTQPEARVQAGVPAFLPPLPPGAPNNRLSFARWLVSRENPLTARVVVNRQWAAFFGRGLVRTQEDFGYQGDLPTHPELLDWLAVAFMDEDGWSLKKLHRRIVMSATYRQSSLVAGRGAEVDHENLLLWRGPRHRLEAEQIRDSALAVTGLLSSKKGGPGVFPPQPPGVTTEGTYGAMAWVAATGEDRYRRSLYTFTKRTAPFAMSNTFDAPTGESCVARRDVSNSPLQSLTLLNDVMFMEAAQALAKETAARPGSVAEKLRGLLTRVFCRPAMEEEVTTLAAFFDAQQDRFEKHELDAVKTGGEGADAARAAWTLTVRALLNTDEFITKI